MMPLLLGLALLATQPASGPPAGSCQAALGPLHASVDEAALPGRVEGATLDRDRLIALRRERGDALITVVGGNFANAVFGGARLHNICFIETNLAGSDWRGARADGIGFVRAVVTRSTLGGARMRDILLRESEMAGVDATRADLSGGRLDGSWNGSLEGLRLDGANLSGFVLDCGITIGDGCPLDRRISMRGADLRGADIADDRLDADWQGARIDRTRVSLGQLRDLRTTNVAGPILVDGGSATVEITPAEYRALLPAIRDLHTADSPSFDCARAASEVERRICLPIGEMIRRDDRILAGLYREAAARDPGIAVSQRAWLRDRDRCAERDPAEQDYCIYQAYERRKSELIVRIGPPAWVRPGAFALFVGRRIEFDDGFRQSALYRRLLPAIVGSASARVMLRVNADGTIDAAGEAVGANAHLCSLAGERLRFDPATGWYSGPYRDDADTPAAWRGRPLPVLRFWADRVEVYRNGQMGSLDQDPRPSDYASCGARAAFEEMVRVPASDTQINAAIESMRGE